MIPVDMPVMLLGYMIYIFSEVFLWLFIAGLIGLLVPRSRRNHGALRFNELRRAAVSAMGKH
ncbi:hypothetical protein [Pseudomonas alloputida]|uniref:hypothetical protein n=1 Tax=Pseudomonas TaxID=286 RepID=UPI003EEA15A5